MKMTWDGKNHRWRKSDKKLAKKLGLSVNHRFIVSCKELVDQGFLQSGVEWNAYNTYKAANAWWVRQVASTNDVDNYHPLVDQIAEVNRKIDWSKRHGHQKEMADLQKHKAELESYTEADCVDIVEGRILDQETIDNMKLHDEFFGVKVSEHTPMFVIQDLFGKGGMWNERLRQDKVAAISKEKSLKAQIEQFMMTESNKVKSREITAKTFDNYKYKFRFIQDSLGDSMNVENLSESHIKKLHADLREHLTKRNEDPKGKAGKSDEYLNSVFNLMKKFVKYLYQDHIINEIPRNLGNLRFKNSDKEIHIMSDGDVRTILSGVPDSDNQLRLHILLMLNCGYRATDIATLQVEEIQDNRIIRKRHKLKDVKNAPTVNYLLWNETAKLLHKYKQKQGIALLTRSGKKWVFSELDEITHKVKQTDSIKSNYKRIVMDKLGISHSYSVIRKTAVSKLDEHPAYKFYGEYFLGECPSNTARKHYQQPSRTQFDEAIMWLGTQFGIE